MSIEVDLFIKSLLAGLTLGFFAGLWVSQYTLDLFAKRIFDSLLKLREQAKSQMDAYDDSLKPKKTGAKQKP